MLGRSVGKAGKHENHAGETSSVWISCLIVSERTKMNQVEPSLFCFTRCLCLKHLLYLTVGNKTRYNHTIFPPQASPMPKTLGRVAYAYAPKASVLGSSRDTVVTNVLAMDLLAMDLQHGKEVGD